MLFLRRENCFGDLVYGEVGAHVLYVDTNLPFVRDGD
jgi:hypothetical protein